MGGGAVAMVLGVGLLAGAARAQQRTSAVVDLPSSKQLLLPVPGDPQRLNSLPTSLAVSRDGRWVVGPWRWCWAWDF
jgi:hypothetical protein